MSAAKTKNRHFSTEAAHGPFKSSAAEKSASLLLVVILSAAKNPRILLLLFALTLQLFLHLGNPRLQPWVSQVHRKPGLFSFWGMLSFHTHQTRQGSRLISSAANPRSG
jgi:hypothetical protein